MRSVVPDLPPDRMTELEALAGSGITRRMAAAADLLLTRLGDGGVARLATHPSDTVRGWAAFMVGRRLDMPTSGAWFGNICEELFGPGSPSGQLSAS